MAVLGALTGVDPDDSECQLPKLYVAGSIPVSRSTLFMRLMRRGNSTPSACPLATLVPISLLGTAVDLKAATVRVEIIGLVFFLVKNTPSISVHATKRESNIYYAK